LLNKLKEEVMRNLDEVINQMLPIVPKELKARLNHILVDKIPWTSPELVPMRWQEVQHELSRFLPATTEELKDWQKQALTIWTQKEYK
jgi:hypothetical protein